MNKFNIGELVTIKNGPMADETCVIMGYGEMGKFSDEVYYRLRFYGGGMIDVPIRESNLERHV